VRDHTRMRLFRLMHAVTSPARPFNAESLADLFYEDCTDGGPLYARELVIEMIGHIRVALAPHGVEIIRIGYKGYYLNRYDIDVDEMCKIIKGKRGRPCTKV
jgi:hypothetical protein